MNAILKIKEAAELLAAVKANGKENTATAKKLWPLAVQGAMEAQQEKRDPKAVQALFYATARNAGVPKGTASTYAKAIAGAMFMVLGAVKAAEAAGEDAGEAEQAATAHVLAGNDGKPVKRAEAEEAFTIATETDGERQEREHKARNKALCDAIIERVKYASTQPDWLETAALLLDVVPALPDAVTDIPAGDEEARKEAAKAEKEAKRQKELADELAAAEAAFNAATDADASGDEGEGDEAGEAPLPQVVNG